MNPTLFYKKSPIAAQRLCRACHWTRPLSLGASWGATAVTEIEERAVSSPRPATELFDLFLIAFFTETW